MGFFSDRKGKYRNVVSREFGGSWFRWKGGAAV